MAETLPPLHPESQAVIDFLMSLNMKPYPEMGSMEEARDRSRRVFMAVELAGEVQYDGTRKELFVPLPDFTGGPTSIRLCILFMANLSTLLLHIR